MLNCKDSPTPVITGLNLSKENDVSDVDPTLLKGLVRILMYLTSTILDIMYVVSIISRFVDSPKESQW